MNATEEEEEVERQFAEFAAVEAARLPFSAMSTVVLEDAVLETGAQSAPLHQPAPRRGTAGTLMHPRGISPGGAAVGGSGSGFLMSSADHGDRGSRSTRGSSLVGSVQLRRHVSRSLSQPEEEMMAARASAGAEASPRRPGSGGPAQTSSATTGTVLRHLSVLEQLPPRSDASEHEAGTPPSPARNCPAAGVEPASTSTWILSFGPDPSQPPTLRRHPQAGTAPELLCIMPLCILITDASEAPQQLLDLLPGGGSAPDAGPAAATAPPIVLHAAGRDLQGSSSEGPVHCWVRHRGHYLPNTTLAYGPDSSQKPPLEVRELMPPTLPAGCDVLRIEFASRSAAQPPLLLSPGLIHVECQRGNGLLGAAKPLLVVSEAGVHAEVSCLWERIRSPSCSDLAQADALMQDLGLWIEAVEKVEKDGGAQVTPAPAGLPTIASASSMSDLSSNSLFRCDSVPFSAALTLQPACLEMNLLGFASQIPAAKPLTAFSTPVGLPRCRRRPSSSHVPSSTRPALGPYAAAPSCSSSPSPRAGRTSWASWQPGSSMCSAARCRASLRRQWRWRGWACCTSRCALVTPRWSRSSCVWAAGACVPARKGGQGPKGTVYGACTKSLL